MVRTRFNQRWSRRGVSLLWDVETLAEIVDPLEVVSIRQMFSMVNAILIDPLPYANADRLVRIVEYTPSSRNCTPLFL